MDGRYVDKTSSALQVMEEKVSKEGEISRVVMG